MSRIRPSGGYRDTCTFQTATIIYDATYWFCEKYLDYRSRTIDQMVQAARSGRQNIAEGSRASASSSQTELRLVNSARFSLEELLLDYEDFLRHRHLPQWDPDSPEALAVRQVPEKFRRQQQAARAAAKPPPGNPPDPPDPTDLTDPPDPTDLTDPPDPTAPTELTDLTHQQRWQFYAPWLEHKDPAIRANALICLINQTNFLLDRQINALEKSFVENGGYSEQLAAERIKHRASRRRTPYDPSDPSNPSDPSDQTDRNHEHHIPRCPQCAGMMVLRTAQSGKNTGKQFWGCAAYPKCKGIVRL